MAANISTTLSDWSVTASSNQPDGTDTADLDAEFQAIQAAVRKYVRSIGADIASASTVNLAAATGEFVSVTGTTTITAFGTVGAGLRYIVRFVSALTVTHNATSLICPGGANLTVKANDIVWLESLGSGNWRVLAYMPVQHTRTWQDVKASRALDTDYTNTNSYPIDVSVTVYSASSAVTSLVIGGVTVASLQPAVGEFTQIYGVVPPGAVYQVYQSSAVYTIYLWAELR